MNDSDSSVTRWLKRLETGDSLAAERLWQIFFERLVYLAHSRLQARYRKAIDAEDIALSAFHSFCVGVEKRKFPLLSDRAGLWRLLVSIAVHKLLHAVRDQNRIKRGGQFRELQGLDSSSSGWDVLNQVVSREPTPEFAAEVAEQYEHLIRLLGNEELKQLASWKMEGFSNEEIAAKLGKSPRTVERKLNLIRQTWTHSLVEPDSESNEP
ncbi:MAG: ECF-type sigma factor [Pirellulaceae bacterium]|nr:ECF-type sigma factor [Pirellulaceae bacterium]